MRASAIRGLAGSWTGSSVAASEFERTVHVWDIESGARRAELATIMDAGGDRVAISDDGLLLAAGAYHVHGIAMYDVADGNLKWQRKDLKKAQVLKFSKDDLQLLAFFEVGSSHILDASSGATIAKLRGVSFLEESPFASLRLVGRSGRLEVVDSGTRRRMPEASLIGDMFAKAAFTEEGVVCTAKRPPRKYLVRFPNVPELELETVYWPIGSDRPRWRHRWPTGVNVLDYGYGPESGIIYAVTWPVDGGDSTLVHLSKETGETDREIVVPKGAWATGFALKSSRLVTSAGDVMESRSGRVTRVLAFPLKEYPERVEIP